MGSCPSRSERWRPLEGWIGAVESVLLARRARVRRGGNYDRWDLDVSLGAFGRARVFATVEDHGAGNQLVRFRSWPRPSGSALTVAGVFAGLATLACLDQAWLATWALGALTLMLGIAVARDCAEAQGSIGASLDDLGDVKPINNR